MGTEVEKKDSAEVVAGHSAAELDQLAAEIKSKTKQSDIVLPLNRMVQPMSKAAEDGAAKPGDFVNSLTGENYGSEIEFIVAGHFYGVSYSNRDEDFFAAIPGDANTRIPSSWPHPDAGKLFGESDAFEDRFKELVNSGVIEEWGDGPDFSITYNFVGYRKGDHAMPERVSLMKTSSPAAKKLLSLTGLDRFPWGHRYKISTRKVEENGNRYWVADVVRGEATEPDDLEAIVPLAVELHRASEQDIVFEGDSPSESSGKGEAAPVEEADGAIEID